MNSDPGGSGAFIPDGPVTVAVVIVTYNSAADLPSLIVSLRGEAAQIPTRIVVVDNSSADGSLELAREHTDVVAVASGGNLGYAAALNIGQKYVGHTESILVLNPDVRVGREAVARMLHRLRSDDRIGVVVPRIVDEKGRTTRSLRNSPGLLRAGADALFGRHWPTRPRPLTEHVRDDRAYASSHEVDWATGAALLISGRAAATVGNWDERFFLYSEETDYFTRVRQAGWKVWYEPEAQVMHRQGGSGVSDDQVALTLVNRVRYMDKHRPRSAELYRVIVTVGEFLRRHDPTHARARWALPVRDRWRHLPGATYDPVTPAGFPSASVIIPAHDEEAVLGRTLAPLARLAETGTLDVIVVCNGCADRTAELARSYPGVSVVEIEEASKPAALNAGDAAARYWPRVYLDADIVTTPKAVADLIRALETGDVLAARPVATVDTSHAGRLVRAYYRARSGMPSLARGMWGAGVYGLNQVGHERLGRFPSATADDLVVDQLFDSSEKKVIDTTPVIVQAPRTIPALLQVATRARRGSAEQAVNTGSTTGRELLRTVRGPQSAFDAAIYSLMALTARQRARAARAKPVPWERDLSTRSPAPGSSAAVRVRRALSVDHVICTRFNLPTSIGPESVIRAKEGWLRDRISLFERYTVPSMRAQTNQDFKWIVYLDSASPDWLIEQLQPFVDEGLITPLYREAVSWQDLAADARQVTGASRELLLTTNLDNDDAVASDFIARLQHEASTHPSSAIYLLSGLIMRQGAVYLRHDPGNAFCSVAEPWATPQTAWRDVHNRLHQHFPVVVERGAPGWLQVVHDRNVSNRVRGRRVSPEPYRERYPGMLNQVSEVSRRAILMDRIVEAPLRRGREATRAAGKSAIERIAGKRGLHNVNALIEQAKHAFGRR